MRPLIYKGDDELLNIKGKRDLESQCLFFFF